MDAPVQQFFSFHLPAGATPVLKNQVSSMYAELLRTTGFDDMMKLELFIIDKNSILMRIENMGDLFDSKDPASHDITMKKIYLETLAKGLYTLVNGLGSKFTTTIQEMSLTAN